MARKPDFIRTQFRIPSELSERIDRFADEKNLSKNQAMINLIEKGLGDSTDVGEISSLDDVEAAISKLQGNIKELNEKTLIVQTALKSFRK